jgi:1-acyl-sn-glycerol-3-phosphate acyltransferase
MAPSNRPGPRWRRKILLFLIRQAMRGLLRLEINGFDNIPAQGPLIIVINHIALLDPVVVCALWPGPVTPLAKQEAFTSLLLRWLLNGYGAIAVRRGEADVGAIRSALRVLAEGESILLAPEGTRSPTYALQKGKEGAVFLALRSGVPIVPVGVTGTHQIKASWRRLRLPRVRLSVGAPFYLQPSRPENQRIERAAMIRETMYRLSAQLPDEYRGIYGDLAQSSDDFLVPT